jgi:hypothetical protein
MATARQHVAAGVGFFANILPIPMLIISTPISPTNHYSISGHFGVEEQFYVSGLRLRLAVAYRRHRNIGYLMVGVVFLSF